MNQELFERIARRCVGHEDDAVALTKGEVKALIEAFNQDRDALLGQMTKTHQGSEESILKEARDQIRRLDAEAEYRIAEARKTASILNDRNFDILGLKEHIRSLEEANELLRHNRERANDEIARRTKELEMNGHHIAALKAQLASANKWLREEKEKVERLQGVEEQLQAAKEMNQIFDKAKLRLRLDPQ